MTHTFVEIRRGQALLGRDGKSIGTVDAVFADYLLVRTRSLLPVDLYVPRNEVSVGEAGEPRVDASAEDAYQAWHRPLRRVAHD